LELQYFDEGFATSSNLFGKHLLWINFKQYTGDIGHGQHIPQIGVIKGMGITKLKPQKNHPISLILFDGLNKVLTAPGYTGMFGRTY
jgi:hypothetical protein